MARSFWKEPYIDCSLYKNTYKRSKKKIFAITRNSKILPSFVGKYYDVYNGYRYSRIVVTEKMVDHKFGEFIFTKKNKKNGA